MGGKGLRHLVQFFRGYFGEGWEQQWARPSEAIHAFTHGERPGAVRLTLADLQLLLGWDFDEEGLRKELHALGCTYRPWYEGSSATAWLHELQDRFSAALHGHSYDQGHPA